MRMKLSAATPVLEINLLSFKKSTGTVSMTVCVAAWNACSQARPTASAKLLMMLRMAFSKFWVSMKFLTAVLPSSTAEAAMSDAAEFNALSGGNPCSCGGGGCGALSQLLIFCHVVSCTTRADSVWALLPSPCSWILSANWSNKMIANIAKAVKRKALMTSRKCVSKLLNNLTAVAEHRRSNNQLVLMAVVLRTLLTQRSRTGDSDDLPVAPAFLTLS
mmetsp:Transcript_3725/g.10604  ORF Transcript_3725/g.10604 Transcript_3725/m.10604 type:complete len:218 (-) Transcript_3725:440-1093(-)